MQARRPQLAEIGVFLLVVALPLVFTPFSASPFGDPKLVVLTAGTLALWAAGLPIDRRLAWAAGAWAAVTVVAAAVGVSPSLGLTALTEGQGSGLILVACSAALAVLGAGLPADLRSRARRWLVATGAIVAAIGVLTRVFPGLPDLLPSDIRLVGATLGNQVFAIGFLAAAIAAAIGGLPDRITARSLALLALLALGAATFGERSSIVLPVVATAATVWRARSGITRAAVVLAAVLVPLLAWQLVDATVLPDASRRADALTGIAAQATDVERVTVWRAMTRAGLERPLLGWGPGSSRSGFLAVATADEIERANRNWADAHNLFLETFVGSGALGLLALAWLCGLLAFRAFRAPRDRAWAFGGAVGIAAYSLVEPFGLVLTPFLFLLAGVASSDLEGEPAGEAVGAAGPAGRLRTRWARVAVGVALAVATLVSVQMLAAASFERWGRVYGETWALQASLRVQPWRLSATERLALIWALDGRAGDPSAGERAREEIGAAVEANQWDPDVRFWAADVETLLFDDAAARAWLDEHLERFPGDVAATTGEGPSEPGGSP